MRDCPQCFAPTFIMRAGQWYCADCGFGRELGKVAPPKVAVAKAPEIPLDEAITKLHGARASLESLAKDFSFEIPRRVFEIFEIAEDVIRSRHEAGPDAAPK